MASHHDTSGRWVSLLSISAAGMLCALIVLITTIDVNESAAKGPAATAVSSAPAIDTNAIYHNEVRPLLEAYCFRCHGERKKKGGLNLAAFEDEPSVLRERKRWELVFNQLHAREMPPEDARQPTPAERDRITAWIESVIDKCDCDGPPRPGRVTIRRLNRVEYANTLRDLLGVEVDAAADLPADDVGYGFDNIADVLSMSPTLMEKYLSVAEASLDEAIVEHPRLEPERRLLVAASMESSTAGRAEGRARWLYSNGEVFDDVTLSHHGAYRVKVRAWGDSAGGAAPKMELRLDGKVLATFDVPAPRDRVGIYEATAQITAGKHRVSAAFTNDYYQPDHPNPAERDRNLIVDSIEITGPIDAPPKKLPESHARIFFVSPASAKPDVERDAARRIVERMARRAFRRPVEAGEVDRLMRLYDLARGDGRTHEASVKLALTGVLCSPHFLFRIERERQPDEHGNIRLSHYELATRLSYFLWSTMPDEALMQAAAAGRLHDAAELRREVQRMLADPKAAALIEQFAEQWLTLRKLDIAAPDVKRFPAFDEKLREAMRAEPLRAFERIVREDRRVIELLDADWTFVNERLAQHYGIEGVTGEAMRLIELADRRRGGVLTMAGVLTVTSDPARTSPVMRGKWVLEQLLAAPPPPPPPDVGVLEEGGDEDHRLTLRQRLEQHRADPNCASCHARMDPIGFALEQYDAIGRWRERDNGQPIDASGKLPDGRRFSGAAELKRLLADDADAFARALAEKMLTYALGRGLEYYDICAINDIVANMQRHDYRFSSLVMGIVTSDAFRYRAARDKANEHDTSTTNTKDDADG